MIVAFAPKGIFLIFTCFVATAALVDFYQTLGLPRGASQQDVDLAYRQLSSALACEVDAPGNGNNALLEAVAHAYEVLGDPARRQIYDMKTYSAKLHRTVKEDSLLFSPEEISALQPRTLASELAEMLREGQQIAIEQIESLRAFTRSNGVFVVFLCVFTLGLVAFYLRPFRELHIARESVEKSEQQEPTPAPVTSLQPEEEEVGSPDDEVKLGEESVEEVIRPSVLVDVAVPACPPSSFAVVSPTLAPVDKPQTVPLLSQERGPVSNIGIDFGYKIHAVPLSMQSVPSSRPAASHQDYSSSHSVDAETEERFNQLASAVPTPTDASAHTQFHEATLKQVPDANNASELKEELPINALEQSGVTTPIRNTDASREEKRLTGTKRRIDAIKSKRESKGLEEVEKKIRLELVH